MNAEKNIEDFLQEVVVRDGKEVLNHTYVFPKQDVGERLKSEIARRAKCKAAQLPFDSSELLLSSRLLSARPEKFVSETLAKIGEVIDGLQHEKATSFDVMFLNPAPYSDPTYHWGDQIAIRVRFAT